MVIVGHSQGGLLTKMMGVHMDQDGAGRALVGTPLSELGLEGADADLVRRCFEFEPLPTVDRLVFVATPHRGSFLAASWFARSIAKLIAMPGEVEGAARRVLAHVPSERLPPGLQDRIPTSLENMDPASPFVRYLAELPIDPRIHAHSIIPIGKAESTDGADDGVVSYASAHLEGVESEVLVPAGHSCQSHPRTTIELRRILREHIRLLDGTHQTRRSRLFPILRSCSAGSANRTGSRLSSAPDSSRSSKCSGASRRRPRARSSSASWRWASPSGSTCHRGA